MHGMTWVILGLVAAIIMSTFHKMLPRGRHLQLHRIRDRARELGFVVDRQAGQNDPLLEGCMGYRLAVPRCPVAEEFSARRVDGVWQIFGGESIRARALTVLVTLPNNVAGLDRHGFSLVIHWTEPNDLATLEQLKSSLQPLLHVPV